MKKNKFVQVCPNCEMYRHFIMDKNEKGHMICSVCGLEMKIIYNKDFYGKLFIDHLEVF